MGVRRRRWRELPAERVRGAPAGAGAGEHAPLRPRGHAPVREGRLMLTGTAAVESLPAGRVPSWDVEPAPLEGFEVVQALFELRTSAREEVLPPALHPTNPPTLAVQVWRCSSSPWGAFEPAQVRVQCRSGLRPRGFVTGSVVDNQDAGDALAAGWGFTPRLGEVRLRRFY